jgi:hypothetical protein
MSDLADVRELIRALNAWSRADGRGIRSGGGHDGLLDSIQFHWNPDPRAPEAHVTFQATIADGRPAIRVTGSDLSDAPPRPNRPVTISFGPGGMSNDAHLMGREPNAV